ncbi:MAG: hypothetical protein LBS69_00185 [Prevotellaceae bacterium]|jgi:hypothetical protein|nr:hypothetical protein [Prevotellaceae bacterium]
MKGKKKSPATGRRVAAQGAATEEITEHKGNVSKPKHVCLMDVIAFITNANQREFKVINSTLEARI